MNNVIDIETLRKIKALEQAITEKTQIQIVKNSYLNKLQEFQKYGTVRIECHRMSEDISRLGFAISKHMLELRLLRKEVE